MLNGASAVDHFPSSADFIGFRCAFAALITMTNTDSLKGLGPLSI